jgi:hypothetical protein
MRSVLLDDSLELNARVGFCFSEIALLEAVRFVSALAFTLEPLGISFGTLRTGCTLCAPRLGLVPTF